MPPAQVKHAIKAALPGRRTVLLAEMPLAGHGGEVAGFAQHFGHRYALFVEPSGCARRTFTDDVIQMPHPGLMWIESGQQAGTRGRTTRRVVKLREAHSLCRQRVKIGRRNFAAITPDVRPAHVVDKNDDDVGPGIRLGSSSQREECTQSHGSERLFG